MPVFPEKYWKDHKLSDPLATLRLPVVRTALRPGKWGKILSFPRERLLGSKLTGKPWTLEFDTIRYDYYLDDNVAFEAFKQVPLICVWKTTPKTGPRAIP